MNTWQEKYPNFVAGEDLEKYRRVKLDGNGARTVVYADAGEDCIGVTLAKVDSGDQVAVLVPATGTFPVIGADTFDAEAALYGADDGKVSDTVSGDKFATAVEACTAADQVIEAIPARATDLLSMQSLISDPAATASDPDAMTASDPAASASDPDAMTATDPTLDASDITDNSGGVDPGDHTIAAITGAAAITDNSGGTDPGDDTIAAIGMTVTDPSDSPGTADALRDDLVANAIPDIEEIATELNAAVAQLAAKQNTTSTAVTAIKAAIALIAAEYNSLKDDTEANETSLEALIDDVTSIRTQVVAAIDDIQANNAAVDALIDDVTSIRTQLVAAIDDIQANNSAIDSIIDALQANGIVATS